MFSAGKLLIGAGALVMIAGLALLAVERLIGSGRLPGDVHVDRPGFSFHFPLVTCLVVSAVLTLLLNIFFRGR